MVHPELTLTIQEGEYAGFAFRGGRKKRVTVGRTRVNAFQIKITTVSQKHALIEWKGEHWVLQDLGSSNGTFLNETALDAHVPVNLSDGDVVTFGPDIGVKVQIAQETVEKPKEKLPDVKGKEKLPNVKGKEKMQAEKEPSDLEVKVQEVKVEEVKMQDLAEPKFNTLGNWLESEQGRLSDRLHRGVHSTMEDMVTYAKELQVELVEYASLDINDLALHMAC